jgi:hypothetical protein
VVPAVVVVFVVVDDEPSDVADVLLDVADDPVVDVVAVSVLRPPPLTPDPFALAPDVDPPPCAVVVPLPWVVFVAPEPEPLPCVVCAPLRGDCVVIFGDFGVAFGPCAAAGIAAARAAAVTKHPNRFMWVPPGRYLFQQQCPHAPGRQTTVGVMVMRTCDSRDTNPAFQNGAGSFRIGVAAGGPAVYGLPIST